MGRPILSPHHLFFNCKISYGQVSLKYVFKLYQLFPLINYVLKKIKIWGEKTDRVGKELTSQFFPPGKELTSQFFPRGKNGPAHSFPGEKTDWGKN